MGKKFDFDKVTERRNTGSLKYDGAARRGKSPDLLPMWVADMDFPTCPEVIDALTARAAHGIFGYSEPDDGYFDVLSAWMSARFNWRPSRDGHLCAPGIVFALAAAVRAFTDKGDGVLIQPPVYYPFREVIECNGRRVVNSPLIIGGDGVYAPDFDDLERKISDNSVKLFILCSPHNPVGRVWTADELRRIARICAARGVIVVSDEIHADFVYAGHKHRVFAEVNPDFERAVVCTSPSKSFNLAGLQFSDIFIPDRTLRTRFAAEIRAAGYSQLNSFGIVAAHAAYRCGGEWFDALLQYLAGNAAFIARYLSEHAPRIAFTPPQGTYLAWLDCRALRLDTAELDNLITERAGLWLDGGTIFGKEGKGFQRLNFACPRTTLSQALSRLSKAIE
jgi:cystathionine beta-lyase